MAAVIIMFIIMFIVVFIIVFIRVMFIAGRSKASKEEQGRKGYHNDSEEIHLVGLEGTGHWHSAQARRHRLGEWIGPFYKKIQVCIP